MTLDTGLGDDATRGPDNIAFRRLTALFDGGIFTELDSLARHGDSLAGVVTGFGTVNGNPVYAFSQDSSVDGGAMSLAQASKIRRIYDLALKTGAPVVGIYDSAGAYLSEGAGALTAFGELIQLSNRLSGVVPQISVVAGTCGGSSAMLAVLADWVIMSEEASLFLTPPSLQGEDAGTAALAARGGAVHLTAPDESAALAAAGRLLLVLPANNLSEARSFETAPPAMSAGELAFDAAPVDTLIAAIADGNSVFELSPEYAAELRTVLATMDGVTVGFVGTDRAKSPKLSGAAAKKAARFVRFCDAFSLPVITLVDTDGFESPAPAEESAALRDAAALTHAYCEATCPKISLIFGRAVGPAFAALAGRASGADLVFAWQGAVISPLESQTAVSVLWNERIAAGEQRPDLIREYEETLGSAAAAAAGGYLDGVISPQETRIRIAAGLEVLAAKRVATHPKKHSNLPL